MPTQLNIAALARRTGVAPDTLRKWEQRYGVLTPTRTPGGQRRYSDRDVQRVIWLRERLREGWRIGEAARILCEGPVPGLEQPAELRLALVDAAERGAHDELDGLLDQAFAVLPLTVALGEVAAPALVEVGERWHAGTLGVVDEHALSQRVRARLGGLLADARGGVRGTVVLACAPGEQHELGLLMLAVLLHGDGWSVDYLGPATPLEGAVAVAARVGAAALCLSAAQRETLDALRAEAATLPEPPHCPLVVGGAGVRRADARALGALHANGDLAESVARVREAVAA